MSIGLNYMSENDFRRNPTLLAQKSFWVPGRRIGDCDEADSSDLTNPTLLETIKTSAPKGANRFRFSASINSPIRLRHGRLEVEYYFQAN